MLLRPKALTVLSALASKIAFSRTYVAVITRFVFRRAVRDEEPRLVAWLPRPVVGLALRRRE